MIKVALIGCGYWGKNYVTTLKNIEGVELAWIYDSRTIIEKENLPLNCKLTNKYSDILKDKEVKGVIIATPTETHYKIAKMALKKGKDVLVEKPMTDNSKNAFELNKLAKKLCRILMVGHIFIFNPAIIKLKEIIKNNELGNIKYIYSRRSGPGPVRKGTNAMWNLAPHDISISNFLTDQFPISVSAIGASITNKKTDDTVLMTLNYKKIKTFIYVSWSEPLKIRETMVVGDLKTAIFDDAAEEKLKVYNNKDPSQIFLPTLKPNKSPLERQCCHFIKCIEMRQNPITDGTQGYLIIKILESIQKSMQTNKEIKIKKYD